MEFKRCVRCGSFFVTEGEVCSACMPKDKLDRYKFDNYIESNSDASASAISINTGISQKNVNRYMNNLG